MVQSTAKKAVGKAAKIAASFKRIEVSVINFNYIRSSEKK